MKRIIIIGNSSYSDTIRYYIEEDASREVVAYAAEEKYITEDTRNGLPVVNIDNLIEMYNSEEYSVIMGIGYTDMNSIRERLYNKCLGMGYDIENYIHSTAVISKNAIIGRGNIFLENAIVGPNCVIGNGNIFFISSVLAHDDIIGDFNFLSVNVSVAGFVNISDSCFLGISSTVKNNINIPSSVLLGANAYLSQQVKEGQVIVPSKSIVLEGKTSRDFV
ncbi:acetyltransferase [Anaerosporobacter sp.]|uniref:acetyltransferase n=1 Tax=Anaerosporobacter sp. TaxID=1872529 RepID=UPI00286EDA7F|nr:acetyltransferase [Anaerosporobacter sp.]